MKTFTMNNGYTEVTIDDVNHTVFKYYNGRMLKAYREGEYRFDQIRGVEILKNNQQVTTGGHGFLGGVLFGTPGAIIGSNIGRKTQEVTNSIAMRIYLRNADKAFVDIDVFRKDGNFMWGKVLAESEQACMGLYYEFMDYLEGK